MEISRLLVVESDLGVTRLINGTNAIVVEEGKGLTTYVGSELEKFISSSKFHTIMEYRDKKIDLREIDGEFEMRLFL